MPIRAVIFDFGGVLMRTLDQSGRRAWEMRLGLPERGIAQIVFSSETSIRAQLGELPEEAVWEQVAATFGLGAEEMADLKHHFWDGDRLDQELIAFMRELRPRYKVAILSNAWNTARRVFTKYGLDEVTDLMVISAEEGVMKPHPRIYEITLERLGVQAPEAVFVDDMPENVQAARDLGMCGVHFQDTAQAIAEVRRCMECGTP